MPVGALAAALIALAGCTTSKLLEEKQHAVEIDGVPFFAQERYQCGPAALATVLVYGGVDTSPEILVPQVYIPERKGSFQAELMAATRSAERFPYELVGGLDAMLAEIDAGNPVLVMQNLGLSWLPKWHYAVVIGYDPVSDEILLRSGTEPRHKESTRRFLYSWQRADYWAMVILRPGQLPATAAADAYLNMLSASEGRVSAANLELSMAAAIGAFPGSADLQFAGGNEARLRNDPITAARRYRAALALNPKHAGALNNYADLFMAESCLASAKSRITTALENVTPDSPLYATVQATSQEIEAGARLARGLEDTGALCATLANPGLANTRP